MTAQDDKNNVTDFAYPTAVQDDNAVQVTQPDPNAGQSIADPATTTTQVTQPEPVRGNIISGPSLEGDNPPIDLPSVEGTIPSSDPIMENPVESPVDPQSQFVQEPVDDKVEESGNKSENGKKENPLQALARKLSELKSELIEDDAKTDTAEMPTTVPQMDEKADGPSVDTVLPELSETNTEEVPSVLPEVESESPSNEATPDIPVELPELSSLPVENPTTPAVDLSAQSNLDDIMPTSDTLPEVAEPDAQTEPTAELNATPDGNDVLPGADLGEATEEIMESSLPGVDISEAQSPNPEPNLSDTGPEAIMPEMKVEETVTETSSTNVIEPLSTASPAVLDEGDVAMVTEQSAEVASAGSKYPLSINKLLDIAIERNASDLLISVGYPAMIRIDGTLIEANEHIISPENAVELVYPVLSDQKKELLEVNREVDLAYSHNKQGLGARFRINAFFSRENLAAAFRLIPTKIRTIEELQLPAMYSQFANLNQGLILVTGPTGHGKSTTLAAIIQAINMNRAVHIITIEDPIEYIFPKSKAVIDQREMHDDTHSWTIALKSALRQDPDVILVGEMRDYETIASAITLAETGHLVFATLHTNSASQTIDRIIDVFPENQQAQVRTQLANIIEAVVAQRLIPLDNGGRRAVSEIMLGTPAVKNLVREGKTHQVDNVIRTSADIGMISLEHSLVKLVREGLITMEKAQEYAVHPEEVTRLLKS